MRTAVFKAVYNELAKDISSDDSRDGPYALAHDLHDAVIDKLNSVKTDEHREIIWAKFLELLPPQFTMPTLRATMRSFKTAAYNRCLITPDGQLRTCLSLHEFVDDMNRLA